MLRIAAPKWLGAGARPFALTFELAQKQIAPYGRNLFAGSQVVTHGMLRAGTTVAIAPHCVPVLAFRASRSKPLRAWPGRWATWASGIGPAGQDLKVFFGGEKKQNGKWVTENPKRNTDI
jgi:hypothetical protein